MLRQFFRDRAYAGRLLAQRLKDLALDSSVLVLGLPRGGVPVAHEIATTLSAPLDVLGEERELERRGRAFRTGPLPSVQGATVILVDDGISTGASMQAAVVAVRKLGAAKVVVAAPVMSQEAYRLFSSVADRCECLIAPDPFESVGTYYTNFPQLSDADVRLLLSARRSAERAAGPQRSDAVTVGIPARGVQLFGDLVVPFAAKAIVVFAHGSGSSRRSARNRQVAAALNQRGIATLLLDLLTEAEEQRGRLTAERFDIELLSWRLMQATDWLLKRPNTRELPLGYFGATTGAAAALLAAAARPDVVHAVVSRGGRPDLVAEALPRVQAPTLLIVGGHDFDVLALNRFAKRYLQSADSELVVVPGATHLFEEPGALDEVARLAADWFQSRLVHAPAAMAAG